MLNKGMILITAILNLISAYLFWFWGKSTNGVFRSFFWGIGALLTFVNRGNLEAIQAGEMTYDYTIPIFILVICGIISILLSYKLKKADKKQGFGLELPS